MDMTDIFEVGDEINGFCSGCFGRDDYEDKVCVMVAPMYAIFEYRSGCAALLDYVEWLNEVVEEWK
jgi:hypothetical protein